MNDAVPSLTDLPGLPEPLTHESPADDDYHRRFGGVARLYGNAGLARLEAASVCVVGIGGVGSWAAEALARNAVGRITLIDLDHIALSNTNRQIHALGDAYGRAKVEAMAERVLAINPRCQVTQVDDFVTLDNVAELLGTGLDYVIDAIDAVRVKTAMLGWARRQGVPVITCGGAGGQFDPTRVRIDDLARTIQDPLLAKVRANLRKDWGFTRDPKKKFGIAAVYSDEPLQYPAPEQQACEIDEAPPAAAATPAAGPQGLACAGFGSSVAVTAVFGFVAASAAIGAIARGEA
ncbi:tRNA cyclic N6-threonylcarbamoyladenosine(37) synthase TcdA [Cupriavidus sp. WKF15]|uniref:tRNA cyclic N6-threonylcarbamoyladenosine(37) synthase TcdA n=1 Tax=Cupriavidus sp. WKF15 TaxID=3032282 RepID=UPI0023E2E696|nr:tRNA cyclic N6-threonylcarbamoyladenosine(37) synthase TcdA [Cupriavidus sp. WKF15]WER45084.1 tRNA cyclic N6-threonylcarbamoyladenosine(37) synthase TcdA [Cupriavidus sp. WKF15]